MGVSLANARVGVLRAALSLRCFALLTHPPHASRSCLEMFYLNLYLRLFYLV
ncbi:MAG: hypothetical protein NZ455_09925 [Bacteroidia bacterium]|nr:hypothetical protein [Bacteroidia bacterium]MDW8347045.1 hypothetical protein [Bacteroidia bacterium]